MDNAIQASCNRPLICIHSMFVVRTLLNSPGIVKTLNNSNPPYFFYNSLLPGTLFYWGKGENKAEGEMKEIYGV